MAGSGSDEYPLLLLRYFWIASRSLSSGAHSRDPLARSDEIIHCRSLRVAPFFSDARHHRAGAVVVPHFSSNQFVARPALHFGDTPADKYRHLPGQ